ncbi:MAG: hypothetical protein PHW79_09715 [Candidatus Marinimicrobia bacterium]|nr:hypothetical protein [Candidatus Neomarinimicrobiota bacterium]
MNKIRFLQIIQAGLLLITIVFPGCSPTRKVSPGDLAVTFKGDAKIEVGGPFVGAEFHHSYMIPQRISFFYPVANSIDRSQDYWKRDTSFVAEWFLKIGDGPRESIGRKPVEFELTPYSVEFFDKESARDINVSYHFCGEKPAMVVTYQIINRLNKNEMFEFETRLFTSIRTCHTFRVIDKAAVECDSASATIYTNFADADAHKARVFVSNAGERPVTITPGKTDKPSAHFTYRHELAPGDTLKIVQLIGSANQDEGRSIVAYLQENYEQEIQDYEASVLKKATNSNPLQTGDVKTDHSIVWAKAEMEANAHYLDGEVVPMPCPAEYNFYFTHDVLVSNLAAVNFDLKRVRRDLDYIVRHADKDLVIPHAYYWKDGKYVTEFASSDNWNNFWFVQVTAKYLRHSGETEFAAKLYPYLTVCVERSLLTKEADNLMWSYRPDWWDIGHNYGSRSYMTILAIKTLRDYNYISTVLRKNPAKIDEYAVLADSMQAALIDKLWSAEQNYLINFNDDGSQDKHYYIGSLLAAHYGLLDNDKQNRLVQTAKVKLLDEKVGIYNVFPMDFHLLGDFYKFVGNEVGAEYYYANGGIWPQGNAWYAMALIANGEKQAAAEFIDETMSFNGILAGPNGQPAYYEVRNANKENPAEYGTVDKPNFLWAGAWYLNSLYQLYGVTENDWNITIDPFLTKGQKKCRFTLFVNGQQVMVDISGRGETIKLIKYDGKAVNSAVFPDEMPAVKEVEFILGAPKEPYLKSTNAILRRCKFQDRQLFVTLSGIVSQNNETVIISPTKPAGIILNGQPLTEGWTTIREKTGYRTTICFNFTLPREILDIQF